MVVSGILKILLYYQGNSQSFVQVNTKSWSKYFVTKVLTEIGILTKLQFQGKIGEEITTVT